MDNGFSYWLQAQAQSPHTSRNHLTGASLFVRWCEDRGLDPRKAGRDDLTRWLAHIAVHLAPSTLRLRTLNLRIFYDYLLETHQVETNPAREIKIRKQVSRPVEVIQPDELTRMLDACETHRDRAVLLLLIGGGLRRDEVFKIERQHVDFDQGTIAIFGKGEKWRTVAPGIAAMEALRFAIRGKLRLCPRSDSDFVRRRVKRIAELAGVKGRIYPHRFRHTFATSFCEAGGGVDLLQTILGHENIEMSIYYSRVGRQQRALQAQRAFNPADRLLRQGRDDVTAAGAG